MIRRIILSSCIVGLAVGSAACLSGSTAPGKLTSQKSKWEEASNTLPATPGQQSSSPAPRSASERAGGDAVARAETSAWPDISRAVEVAPMGSKDAAVIVAIERYAFLSPIEGATKNAQDWYTYFTKSLRIPVDRVTLIVNEDATAESMLEAARGAARAAKPGGRVWFVFIGHGAPEERGEDGLLVAVDAQQSTKGIARRSLQQGELLAALGKGGATPVAVVDACFSGQSNDGELLVKGLMPSKVVQPDVPPTAIVFSAARSDQFAGPLPGEDRPAFSYLMLGGLRGWADDDGDGQVTAEEVLSYSSGTLRTVLRGRRGQHPQLQAGRRDVVLAKGHESGPDLAELVLWLSNQ